MHKGYVSDSLKPIKDNKIMYFSPYTMLDELFLGKVTVFDYSKIERVLDNIDLINQSESDKERFKNILSY